jgi:hypothetical protein
MLSYGTDAKKSQLTSQLYFKDKTGHYDDNDVNNGALILCFDVFFVLSLFVRGLLDRFLQSLHSLIL